MKKLTLAAIVFAATGSAAAAHPGDHVMGLAQSLFHLLTEPDHLAMIGGAVALGVFAWFKLRKRA